MQLPWSPGQCLFLLADALLRAVNRDGMCGAASMTSARQGTSPFSISARRDRLKDHHSICTKFWLPHGREIPVFSSPMICTLYNQNGTHLRLQRDFL
ncbi:hypothetical protein F5144DRAFT_240550 [Chaetomium tenue]|uniref:Uncharacterized protein n=1 Tax=Chaetomium tenue TaxID=1854479 RepID=A0ACB7P9F5_9PEZI|nr:hypothetical protein F5144DRAFT_240550 [Chaetomium globosum]